MCACVRTKDMHDDDLDPEKSEAALRKPRSNPSRARGGEALSPAAIQPEAFSVKAFEP